MMHAQILQRTPRPRPEASTVFVGYQLPCRPTVARSERPRRYVPSLLVRALLPALRFSSSRDAYVLRGVGNHLGPVLRPRLRQLGASASTIRADVGNLTEAATLKRSLAAPDRREHVGHCALRA